MWKSNAWIDWENLFAPGGGNLNSIDWQMKLEGFLIKPRRGVGLQ